MSLNIGETSEPFNPTLPTISTLPHAACRVVVVRFYKRINKSHAWSDLIYNFFSASSAVHWSPQAVLAWVCNLNGMLFVLGFK